jgi:hypothetical protein
MLHTNERIIKNKVGLINLAEEFQNISKACKGFYKKSLESA